MIKLLVITGTRPEIIKMSPILKNARTDSEFEVIHIDTFQHFDHKMNRQFFHDLNLTEPEYRFSLERKSEHTMISSMINQISKLIKEIKPSIVLAQGDTNTVMISAFVSHRLNYPFGHVEAGIRSFDLNMPEEVNRRIADLCASIHFCPTKLSGLNLISERINPERIFITGNTIVDVVKSIFPNLLEQMKESIQGLINPEKKNILLTMHRPINVDIKDNLIKILNVIRKTKEYHYILPIHPRTSKKLRHFGFYETIKDLDNCSLIDPLGYFDFLKLLTNVDLVVTDSGGVQEECLCLNKRCLTIRNNTERPETLYNEFNRLFDLEKQDLVEEIRSILILNNQLNYNGILGDGNSSNLILNIMKELDLKNIEFHSPRLMKWENYQYHLLQIKSDTSLKNFINSNNREVIAIYDTQGLPLIPNNDVILKQGFSVVTIGKIFNR